MALARTAGSVAESPRANSPRRSASDVDARVMDAYSGSGALGFEALSRGARSAVFLESDGSVLRTLQENAAALDLTDRCAFRHGPVEELLRSAPAGQVFDLILADPPYGTGQAGVFLALAARCLAPQGVLVLERDRDDLPAVLPVRTIECYRTAPYGRNCLDFYRQDR